jgi:acetate kinase
MNCVLTINGGSSSIKFARFEQVEPPERSLTGEVERIGLANTVIRVKSADALLNWDEPLEAADLEQAGGRLIDWLAKHTDLEAVDGVGHRVVHGGPRDHAGVRSVAVRVDADAQELKPGADTGSYETGAT